MCVCACACVHVCTFLLTYSILSHRCGMVTRGLAMDLQRRVPPFSISTRHSLVSADNINALANRANGTADVDTHDLVVELDGGCQT